MDLEIAMYFMPRLSCTRASHAATLRKVTNGIIENQYLRSVLTIVPSPSSFCRPRRRATIAVTSCFVVLFVHLYAPLVLNLSVMHGGSRCAYIYISAMGFTESPYLFHEIIVIELREHSFSSARSLLLSVFPLLIYIPPLSSSSCFLDRNAIRVSNSENLPRAALKLTRNSRPQASS